MHAHERRACEPATGHPTAHPEARGPACRESGATGVVARSTSVRPCGIPCPPVAFRWTRNSSFPRPSKPEIFIVADISGSVAAFARFTLQLVHAISSQFSKVRSFVFVDGIDEVTASSRVLKT